MHPMDLRWLVLLHVQGMCRGTRVADYCGKETRIETLN